MRKDYNRLKKRIFTILEIGTVDDIPSRVGDIVIVATIILNILALILETFTRLEKYYPMFHIVEAVTILVFIAEYVLRIWTAEYLFPDENKMSAALRFMLSFDGIIELLTILPFAYLTGFVAFRMLRVVRIFHLFRINATYDSFNVIRTVIYQKRNQLLSSMFLILILMLASSLFMYDAEHEAQPQAFANAFSGIWWSMSTLLTVGYGDIYPVTMMGRAMAIVIAFLGVGVVAIPTGIISAGFVEQYNSVSKDNDPNSIGLHTVILDLDSNWLGDTVSDIEAQYPVIVALIRREDKIFRPDGDFKFRMGDAVSIYNR